jgi:ZIP family zinc transporter
LSALAAAGWGALAALALIAGAGLALTTKPSWRVTGLVMGFGAGALISAVSYELIPESTVDGYWIMAAVLAGALVFYIGDVLVDRRGGRGRKKLAHPSTNGGGRAIFLGTLLDGVPESLVLGMSIGLGGSVSVAFLAAVFISNLPEGVAGTVSLQREGRTPRAVLWMWLALVAASAASAALGWGIVRWLPGFDGAYVQAFAAGAVLTMLADTMMPEAFEHGGKLAGLLTVLGFISAALLSLTE